MPTGERARSLLRSTATLAAFVIVVGAAGILVGIGLSKLLPDDETSSEPRAGGSTTTAPAAGAPTTTAPVQITSGGSLRVDVLSAIVHPLTQPEGGAGDAQIGVHIRVTNSTGRPFALSRPALYVGVSRRRIEANLSRPSARLPGELGPGDVVDTTLRFDVEDALNGRLIVSPMTLRIATKNLALEPITGSTIRP